LHRHSAAAPERVGLRRPPFRISDGCPSNPERRRVRQTSL
jgi:hypothetical protein